LRLGGSWRAETAIEKRYLRRPEPEGDLDVASPYVAPRLHRSQQRDLPTSRNSPIHRGIAACSIPLSSRSPAAGGLFPPACERCLRRSQYSYAFLFLWWIAEASRVGGADVSNERFTSQALLSEIPLTVDTNKRKDHFPACTCLDELPFWGTHPNRRRSVS
jgi:hypothetical protein